MDESISFWFIKEHVIDGNRKFSLGYNDMVVFPKNPGLKRGQIIVDSLNANPEIMDLLKRTAPEHRELPKDV